MPSAAAITNDKWIEEGPEWAYDPICAAERNETSRRSTAP